MDSEGTPCPQIIIPKELIIKHIIGIYLYLFIRKILWCNVYTCSYIDERLVGVWKILNAAVKNSFDS